MCTRRKKIPQTEKGSLEHQGMQRKTAAKKQSKKVPMIGETQGKM
jgi:hypothetical protein